jgi:hypothetical protein
MAVVPLNFDDAVFDSASTAAVLFELRGELPQSSDVQGNASDNGDAFALAAFGFSANAHNSVPGEQGLTAAAGGNGLVTDGAHLAVLGRVNGTALQCFVSSYHMHILLATSGQHATNNPGG